MPSFEEIIEARKKEIAEKKKTQITQKKLPLDQEHKPKVEPVKSQEKHKSLDDLSLDTIRGIYQMLTGKGDKKSNKQDLILKVKEELLKPAGLASWMEYSLIIMKSV